MIPSAVTFEWKGHRFQKLREYQLFGSFSPIGWIYSDVPCSFLINFSYWLGEYTGILSEVFEKSERLLNVVWKAWRAYTGKCNFLKCGEHLSQLLETEI